MLEVLDADAVRRWYRWGLAALEAARPEIDSLNVFPVADADTGTNLYLTLWSAVEAADDRTAAGADLGETATTMARLCLLGARGSSGVILSQLLRGVAEVLAAERRPPAGLALTDALERAVELAYARRVATGRGHHAHGGAGRRRGSPRHRVRRPARGGRGRRRSGSDRVGADADAACRARPGRRGRRRRAGHRRPVRCLAAGRGAVGTDAARSDACDARSRRV